MNHISPLLKVGTFGTHLVPNPKGSFSFVGSIPLDLRNAGPFATESEGILAFIAWFTSMPVAFQREHIGNTRDDVFTLIMQS